MKKVVLFLMIVGLSFSSYAQVKDPCPDKTGEKPQTSQEKAICWRDVVRGENGKNAPQEQRDWALASLQALFKSDPALKAKMSSWWIRKVAESMKNKDTADKFEFYMGKGSKSLGGSPDFEYQNTNTLEGNLEYNRGFKDKNGTYKSGDYVVHAVIKTIPNYEENKNLDDALPGIKKLIKYADVCKPGVMEVVIEKRKDKYGNVDDWHIPSKYGTALQIFEKLYPSDATKTDDIKSIQNALATRQKALNNCVAPSTAKN